MYHFFPSSVSLNEVDPSFRATIHYGVVDDSSPAFPPEQITIKIVGDTKSVARAQFRLIPIPCPPGKSYLSSQFHVLLLSFFPPCKLLLWLHPPLLLLHCPLFLTACSGQTLQMMSSGSSECVCDAGRKDIVECEGDTITLDVS